MAGNISTETAPPDTDQEQAVRAVLRRASAVPMILIAIFGAVVFWQLSSRLNDSRSVDHLEQVIATAEDSALDLSNSAGDLGGYLLVGQDYFLDRYEQSYRAAVSNLDRLKLLVQDNPKQILRADNLKQIVIEWKAYAAKEVALKKSGGDYESMLRSGATVSRMDAISEHLSGFISVEQELRDMRSAVFNRGILSTVILVSLGALVIGGMLVFLDRRDIETVAQSFRTTLEQEAKARARAEAANRAKDQFLNTVSHELRNPLNSVLMWARALQTDNADATRLKRGLQAIERGARSQAQLIEDLIDTARIDSGKLRLEVRPVDVTQVVQAAIEIISLSAESKQIRIRSVLDTRVGRVAGDADRLQQVFWNLLSNAVKFTPKEGRIQVQLEGIDSHIEVSISDTGRGIDPVELPRIFGRFWQAEDTGAPGSQGLGLGLSIAQHIAELHGGRITASSEGIGKGSVFRVRLPIMIANELPGAARRHTALDGTATSAGELRLDGIQVLAVDDERDASLALQALLTALGAEVKIANSADDALMVLTSWVPDVIVSDIGMPGKDGLAMIREIRRQSKPLCDIPGVALTAYGRIDDKINILDAGYQAHVIKPVDVAELTAVIASVIKRGDERHHST